MDRSTLKRRRWADIVVIFTAVYSFLAAVWAPPEALSGSDAREVGNTVWLLYSYLIGGSLGILGLVVVHRFSFLGKLMVGAAGIAVLTGFAAMREITLLAAVSIGLTGLLLLAMAPLVGPMPSREEEARAR